MKKENLNNIISADQDRFLKQKLKALGIDEKCVKSGDVENIEFIPTGVFEVDSILGSGMGIPAGTLIEFCGESQSGKTWLGYKLIAEAQKLGKKCAFFNIENSYYPLRALSCGVNTAQLLLVENVGSAEKYGELLKFMVETGDYSVIVVDSISAMIPNDELEKSLEQAQTIGLHARFVKRLTKDLTAKTAATGTIVVLINQLYMGSGAMPGSMVKTASGGNAMNYFTHMRLWINKINGAAGQVTKKDAEGKDVVIGGKSKVLVMKTRYGQPNVTGEFKIMFTDDETTNPVDEFLYKAKAKGFEYVKEVRKKFIYIDNDYFATTNKRWLLYKELKLHPEKLEELDKHTRLEIFDLNGRKLKDHQDHSNLIKINWYGFPSRSIYIIRVKLKDSRTIVTKIIP